LIAASLAAPAAAQQPPPPKLLVVISVDQLSTALFEEYRPQFTDGFARLASGTVFRNGSPRPAASSLGDLAKAHWPGTRNVAVAGNRALADALSGRNADQRWFWGGARFQTDLPSAAAPGVVAKVNAAVVSALSQPRPALEPSSFCKSKGGQTSALGRAAGDTTALAASPELDGDTLALAAGLIDQMQLGRRGDPDVLSVGLSATGNVASAHGSGGQEMCLQLTELDREVSDFLSLLDSRGIDYAVALTGTASGGTAPMIFWRPGFRGATVDSPVTSADMVATLAALIEVALQAPSGGGRCLEGTPAFCSR
jgi:hypothetical protein